MTALGRLEDIPRARLWSQPTVLEPAPRLAKAVGAAQILIKRDDANGLGMGGNKVRQLEYYLGNALAQGADTVLMTGAVQSNFVRTAAAACAKLGLACHIQLEDRVPKQDPAYLTSGNVLLDQLLGATLHRFPEGENEAAADANLARIAADLRANGHAPYVVPMHPSHAPLGALGYIHCAAELTAQMDRDAIDHVFVASGSGNTHSGLLYGLRALGWDVPVTGVCVRRAQDLQTPRIQGHCAKIAALLDQPNPVTDTHVFTDDSWLPPRYGIAGPDAQEALVTAARLEGLILDPVYTAKVMAGLCAFAKATPDQNLLFIHTGGAPSIFGYHQDITAMIQP